MIKNNGHMAFCGNIRCHLWYGNDINIINSSNTIVGSYCNYGAYYQLPEGITYNTDNSQSFLSGNYSQWLTNEVKVYEIKLD